MEVTLFENQTIQLINAGGVNDTVILRDGTVIKDAHTKTGVINVPVTPHLRDVLKSMGFSYWKSTGPPLQIMLILGFPANAGPGPAYEMSRSKKGYLDAVIVKPKTCSFNGRLTSREMQISVSISTIQQGTPKLNTVLEPVDASHWFVVGEEDGRANSLKVNVWDGYGYGRSWNHANWRECRCYDHWTVTCTAKLILVSRPAIANPEVLDPLVSLRRMLTNELYCDVTVIARNGAEVKFHRSIMASHSSVFNSMFQSGMREARTGIVKMLEMSEESIRALREYLYVWNLEGVKGNCWVCYELLEVSHRYDIQSLEKSMEKTLLQKDHDWYSVDVALQLFLFVRGRGEEGIELKMKAVQVLKWKFPELEKLPLYRELFKKYAEAAMDLMACFAGYF